MNSVNKLFKLADRFERKISLKKTAEELGDTAMVNVRPLVNKMLVGREPGGNAPEPAPPNSLKGKVAAILKKGAGAGDIKVGGNFFFSAKKSGDSWTVTEAHVEASGSLLEDPKVGAALKASIDLFNKMAKVAVQQEINRVKANLDKAADTITNMQTMVDSFNFEIGE